jgi:hypothetical protein
MVSPSGNERLAMEGRLDGVGPDGAVNLKSNWTSKE